MSIIKAHILIFCLSAPFLIYQDIIYYQQQAATNIVDRNLSADGWDPQYLHLDPQYQQETDYSKFAMPTIPIPSMSEIKAAASNHLHRAVQAVHQFGQEMSQESQNSLARLSEELSANNYPLPLLPREEQPASPDNPTSPSQSEQSQRVRTNPPSLPSLIQAADIKIDETQIIHAPSQAQFDQSPPLSPQSQPVENLLSFAPQPSQTNPTKPITVGISAPLQYHTVEEETVQTDDVTSPSLTISPATPFVNPTHVSADSGVQSFTTSPTTNAAKKETVNTSLPSVGEVPNPLLILSDAPHASSPTITGEQQSPLPIPTMPTLTPSPSKPRSSFVALSPLLSTASPHQAKSKSHRRSSSGDLFRPLSPAKVTKSASSTRPLSPTSQLPSITPHAQQQSAIGTFNDKLQTLNKAQIITEIETIIQVFDATLNAHQITRARKHFMKKKIKDDNARINRRKWTAVSEARNIRKVPAFFKWLRPHRTRSTNYSQAMHINQTDVAIIQKIIADIKK